MPSISQDMWHSHLPADDSVPLLQQNVVEAEKLATELTQLRDECLHRPIGPQGREALGKLMPRLLSQLVQDVAPTELLSRIRKILLHIATRSAYLQLLAENPWCAETTVEAVRGDPAGGGTAGALSGTAG